MCAEVPDCNPSQGFVTIEGATPDKRVIVDLQALRRSFAASLLITGLLALGSPTPAEAVSVADLVQLSRAGVTDDVLIALIEADGEGPRITASQVLELKQAGLSDRVVLAAVRGGRAPSEQPAPRTVFGLLVVGAPPPVAVVVTPLMVPVYVPQVIAHCSSGPAPIRTRRRCAVPVASTLAVEQPPGFGRFMNLGVTPPDAPASIQDLAFEAAEHWRVR